jgi:hypothetical protein
MIVFFTYFYTFNVAFKVDDVAENLKNQGGFIPGHPARQADGGIPRVRGEPHPRSGLGLPRARL